PRANPAQRRGEGRAIQPGGGSDRVGAGAGAGRERDPGAAPCRAGRARALQRGVHRGRAGCVFGHGHGTGLRRGHGRLRAGGRRCRELPHRAEQGAVGAAGRRDGRAVLDAEPVGRPGGRDSLFRCRHHAAPEPAAVEPAGGVLSPAGLALAGVAAAAAVGGGMRSGLWARGWAAAVCLLFMASVARGATYFVTVAGLGGEPDYVQRYTADANTLDKIFKQAGPDAHVITLTGAEATRAKLSAALAQVAKAATADDDFVLVLIGHGSYDGVEYKFNLVGPDVSASELAQECNKIAARRQLVVDATEASGGALSALQSPTRAVIAATKSGTEKNATVFARYFVEALQDPAADLDKNEAISAMEAL